MKTMTAQLLERRVPAPAESSRFGPSSACYALSPPYNGADQIVLANGDGAYGKSLTLSTTAYAINRDGSVGAQLHSWF